MSAVVIGGGLEGVSALGADVDLDKAALAGAGFEAGTDAGTGLVTGAGGGVRGVAAFSGAGARGSGSVRESPFETTISAKSSSIASRSRWVSLIWSSASASPRVSVRSC